VTAPMGFRTTSFAQRENFVLLFHRHSVILATILSSYWIFRYLNRDVGPLRCATLTHMNGGCVEGLSAGPSRPA